jgi:hypothetical protein
MQPWVPVVVAAIWLAVALVALILACMHWAEDTNDVFNPMDSDSLSNAVLTLGVIGSVTTAVSAGFLIYSGYDYWRSSSGAKSDDK